MQSVNNSKIQFTENYFLVTWSSYTELKLYLHHFINLEAHSPDNGYMKWKWRGAL